MEIALFEPLDMGGAGGACGGATACVLCVGAWCAEVRWPCRRLLSRLRVDVSGGADDAEGAPKPPWKGVASVPLLAFFSRSSIFFLKVLASFSSAKESPAKQFSSSKEWKKTRSWL